MCSGLRGPWPVSLHPIPARSYEPRSIKGLARAEGICVLHTAKLLPLAFLAPDLVAQILEGRQPRTLTLTALISEPLPLDWAGQRARFAAFA